MIRWVALATMFWLTTETFAQTAVRPLDGRPNAISPSNSTGRVAPTGLEFERAGELVRQSTAIPILLPKDALNDAGDTFSANGNRTLVVDPDGGSWYRYVETRPAYTLTVEGDDRLLVSAKGCAAKDDRYAYLGSAYRAGASVTDQGEGPNKEILFVEDCVPYRVNVECSTDASERDCHDAKRLLGDSFRAGLVRLRSLKISGGDLQRSFAIAAAANVVQPIPRPPGSEAEFRYMPPGLQRVRQYVVPADCSVVAKGAEFTVDRRTPYARLVFGGKDLMQRFPLILPADREAFPNSQIFNPGGGFFVTVDGVGRGDSYFRDDCHRQHPPRTVPKTDGTCGEMGPSNHGDARNFEMPWSDTFCEWRGNEFTQPFCAKEGKPAMKGPHYGVDIRAWSQSMNDHVDVVSVSDGTVVEVGSKNRGGAPPYVGFVVKVRSKHLIFVYRHMNPDLSPFREGAAGHLKLGDRVVAGQRLGVMGDFMDSPGGTTKHLHFEIEAPVPKSVLLGPPCVHHDARSNTDVRSCMAREKAPPFPSLIVVYFRERYGRDVDLSTIDKETGLPTLPVIVDHEITPTRGPAVASASR
jgi:murein DD-endopeptidase MepM/ murein hydrolase activator NlpD